LYDLFVEIAQPRGYGLKAKVGNFPDDMPGDIGLFLSWDAPVASTAVSLSSKRAR
jgi:hypothetical protein